GACIDCISPEDLSLQNIVMCHLPSHVETVIDSFFFYFNDTAPTEIYTLSLHDALPIYAAEPAGIFLELERGEGIGLGAVGPDAIDRKSTRLNSSHLVISYAVFCLKKKKIKHQLISQSCVSAAVLHSSS